MIGRMDEHRRLPDIRRHEATTTCEEISPAIPVPARIAAAAARIANRQL